MTLQTSKPLPLILLAIPSVIIGWPAIGPLLFGDFFGGSRRGGRRVRKGADIRCELILDLPEGATLETSAGLALDVARSLEDVPEIADVQVYAGVAAPFNFNGMIDPASSSHPIQAGNNRNTQAGFK